MRAALTYIKASTAWVMLAVTVLLTVALLSIVAQWPYTMWPLHGAAIGLMAGTAAWATDETSARIVDVAPRPLWWRSAARSVTPVVLAAVWTMSHLAVRDRFPAHLGVFILQGVAAVLLGFTCASWLRGRGRAEPGQWIASFACPVTLGIALAKPWSNHAPLFPLWPHDNWTRSVLIWGGALLTAALVGAWTLWDDAAPRRVRRISHARSTESHPQPIR
jgi:hypothetical protein